MGTHHSSTSQDLLHDEAQVPLSYSPLPDHPPPAGAPAKGHRRPSKVFAVTFFSVLFLLSLVALVMYEAPQAPATVDNGRSPVEIEGRGVAQGVSDKSFRGFSSRRLSFNWTTSMFVWQRTAFHFQPEKNWMNGRFPFQPHSHFRIFFLIWENDLFRLLMQVLVFLEKKNKKNIHMISMKKKKEIEKRSVWEVLSFLGGWCISLIFIYLFNVMCLGAEVIDFNFLLFIFWICELLYLHYIRIVISDWCLAPGNMEFFLCFRSRRWVLFLPSSWTSHKNALFCMFLSFFYRLNRNLIKLITFF